MFEARKSNANKIENINRATPTNVLFMCVFVMFSMDSCGVGRSIFCEPRGEGMVIKRLCRRDHLTSLKKALTKQMN